MCKRLGPVPVRRCKYPLLLLCLPSPENDRADLRARLPLWSSHVIDLTAINPQIPVDRRSVAGGDQ